MPERILLSDLLRNTRWLLRNRWVMLRPRRMDYVLLRLSGGLVDRKPEPPRRRFPLSLLPWPAPPPSVEALDEALERVAADPRVKGVVLILTGLSAGPAVLTGLREAIGRFRRSGKRAVAYVHDLSMWSYYLAAACDEIVAPEAASFLAAGFWSETLFLKDALALAGLQADLESFGEFKASPDTFRRSEMSKPHRQMLESILGSFYDHVVLAVAEGRHLPAGRVRELFDSVPLSAEQSREAGLLDVVCYEDELPAHLGTAEAPAVLVASHEAGRRLVRARRWHSRRAVGVIGLEGAIVPGPSRQPPMPLPIPLPVPGAQAGADTLVQQLRAAARDKRLAAVVLFVDSPGGSAFASDLIWREVDLLRRVKPVVVYMSDVAASGGYYVSAPASAIVAQPTTLTGSIGIWGGKIVTQGLYDKLHVRREVVSRGEAAGLYSDAAPFDDEERARVRAEIGAGYARFKSRVVQGRGLSDEEVEAVAGGRVWTGEQALAHGLVDQLGDFRAAADRARQLARLDTARYVPLVPVSTPRRYQVAQPAGGAAAWLAGLQAMFADHILAMAPWEIKIHG